MLRLALLIALIACPLVCHAAPPAAAPATTKPAPPQIPDVLKPLQARIGTSQLQVGGPIGPMLFLTAHEPLSEEQWAAIENLGIRGFYLSGKGFGDAAMPRFAKLDPTELMIWEMPLTDAGAEHFASMKSLKVLTFVHAGGGITTKTAHTIENHPAMEFLVMPGTWFSDPPTFTRIVQSCKRLRAMAWGHIGSDADCKVLEHHPALEDLWFWPDFTPPGITDAGVTSLATLPKLKKLWLEYSRVSYDGSLRLLKGVPGLETLTLTNMIISDEDLARLRADLPNVKITFTPMKPEQKATYERRVAQQSLPEPLKAVNAQLQPDPLGGTGTMLTVTSTAAVTAEQWAAIEPLRTKFGIRAFSLAGKAGDDDAIARLVAFDPTMLVLAGGPVTDAGLAHVAGMKSLRGLHLAHCGGITPASASVVTSHPTIDNLVLPPRWLNDPATLATVLANPRLKVISLAQLQATDATCGLLARHPGLEELTLSPQMATAGLTNAGLASLATVPKLTKLSLSHARFGWNGGLEHLAKLPALTTLTLSSIVVSQEDIDRLKAATPNAKITFTPMPPANLAAFEKLEAAAKIK